MLSGAFVFNEFCLPVSTLPGRPQLWSVTTGILHVPRTKTSIGSRSFAVAGPHGTVYLLELSVPSFVKRLNTYLFNS